MRAAASFFSRLCSFLEKSANPSFFHKKCVKTAEKDPYLKKFVVFRQKSVFLPKNR